jgi:hypothetical protein
VHLLALASLRGLVVRGPMVGKQHAYVLTRDWLGEPPAAPDRDAALAELARRYLVAHGPASDRDLARWAGLPLRDARAGLAAIASSLDTRLDGLVELARRAAGSLDPPSPRLLGAFDPILCGWTSREWLLDGHEWRIVSGGLFRPFALVRGRAVAVWSFADDPVRIEPFDRVSRADLAALERDARDVERFLRG